MEEVEPHSDRLEEPTMDERRIGRRVEVHDLTMELVAPPPPKKRFGKARPPETLEVEVLDLSVSGALVSAPEVDTVGVGAVVPVRLHGHRGTVAVRRVGTDDRPGRVRLGVEFLEAQPELKAELDRIIGAILHPDREPRWHQLHDD
jgi:hypothetical protein